MKKKYTASTKDKEDWIAFTKQMGTVKPKEVDFINHDIELDKVKKARTLRMPGNYETVGSLLNAVSGIVKYERELDYLDTLAEKRNLINLTQVKNASTKYIDPQKWTWIIVGDLSKVEEGIRDLEIGQVKIIKAQ